MKIAVIEDDNGCFVCGQNNKEGLRLQFHTLDNGKKVITTFLPSKKYQGWKDFVHGGIIITLLDEVMAKAAHSGGWHVMTGEILTRFKNPAKVMELLRIEAEVECRKKKILYTKAAAFKEDGTTVAVAKAKMVLIPEP